MFHLGKQVAAVILFIYSVILSSATLADADAQNPSFEVVMDMIVKASIGDVVGVDEMLQQGLDVNQRDSVGNTPLLFAARYGRTSLVDYLLDHGADVDAETFSGITPLQETIRRGNMDVLRALLAAGADVGHEDGHHENALFDAVKYRSVLATRLLLDRGVPSGTHNGYDITPLLYAVEDDQLEIVEMLLEAGVDINDGSLQYGVALCIARQRHLERMEHYLLQHGAQPDDCAQYHTTVSGWLP